VRNPKNLGLIDTLNIGLDLAQSTYVARMDADDITMPNRFSQQVAFLEANPQIGLVGTWAKTFGAGKPEMARLVCTPDEIRVRLFGFNAIAHPSVMMRMSAFNQHQLRFSRNAPYAEDLDLWMRAADHFQMANIPIVGIRYRLHPNQVTQRNSAGQQQTLNMLRTRQLMKLAPEATQEQINLHLTLLTVGRPMNIVEMNGARPWLETLSVLNLRHNVYTQSLFDRFLAERWFNIAHRCSPPNHSVWQVWRRSQLAQMGLAKSMALLAKKSLRIE
jgi:glycosyltransferase involved in cell wall biosynthesis